MAYKFGDDHGIYLAALITHYGFLFLFPLLLLLASVLGMVLADQPELSAYIVDSAVSQFPLIGTELGDPRGLQGSSAVVVVGTLVAIWGALRASQATQHAMDVCWGVPRHQRPNPLAAWLRSTLLIGTAGLALLGSTVLSALGSGAEALGLDLRGLTTVLLTLLAVTINAVCSCWP